MPKARSFPLMQSLRKSPAVLRRRLCRDHADDLSHGNPVFRVHYLGTEKIFSLDVEQARGAVSQLLPHAPEKRRKDHVLVVRSRYVEVKELSSGRQLTKTYLRDMASCAADTELPDVFLYICKLRGQQLHCRAFQCSSAEKVKEIIACLARSFQTALEGLRAKSDVRRAQGDGKERTGQSMIPDRHSKTSGPPVDLRKGHWRKALVSHGVLRAMRRKTSSVDDTDTQSEEVRLSLPANCLLGPVV